MLPPVPDEPVRPPPVAIAGEVALRIGVREGVELDARLAVPEGARRVVVVAHPHPLYGGTMHNAVVVAIVKAAAARGMATLRFDFRGVGASSGQFDDTVGETDDVAAALAEAARRVPRARLALAGYSFGSACALRVVLGLSSIAHPMPARVALVAPSPRLFRLETIAGPGSREPRPPLLIVAPEHDQYASRADVEALSARLGARLEVVPGDHFLMGARRRVGDRIAELFDEDDGGPEPSRA